MKNPVTTKAVPSYPTLQASCDHISKTRAADFVVLSLLVVGLLYIFISTGPSIHKPTLLLSRNFHPKSPSQMFSMIVYRDELDRTLAETAMPNKTLIISIINKAYVEGDKPMLDLFMDGFWLGEDTRTLRNHLLIVAMDRRAYERCRFLRLRCFKLETDGVDFAREEMYMSDDFIKMMWRRTLFLGDVLKRGYDFIFTDTDIIWLRNPFSHLSSDKTVDLQISTDIFNGQERSKANRINTGFYMIRSNNKTVALFDSWYAQKDKSIGMKEQDVLEKLMHENLFERLRIKVRFLDTVYFSGFCQNSRDVRVVTTIHANCCRSIRAKVTDLISVVHDWKKFKTLRATETATFAWSRHMACENSWKT